MGLLDDVFGKNEINKLKNQLLEKSNEILRLESQISSLTASNGDLLDEINSHQQTLSEKQSELDALTDNLEKLSHEHARLVAEVEVLKQNNSTQKTLQQAEISALQAAIDSTKADSAAIKSERDAMAKDFADLRALHLEKESRFQERERKLAEKSERLLQERQKFQQQAAELHTREQHWKHAIEPKLKLYEAHVSLDSREDELNKLQSKLDALHKTLSEQEADMLRRLLVDESLAKREQEITEWEQLLTTRTAELDETEKSQTTQQAEIEQRTKELNDLNQELSVFRERVRQLDEETSRIASESQKLEAKKLAQIDQHAERISEIREQRAELRQTIKELNQREIDLKSREKNVKREETSTLNIKNKNFELRNEQKRLAALIDSLESEAQEAITLKSDLEALRDQHQELQTNLKSAENKAKGAEKDRQEINRLTARIESLSQATVRGTKFNSSLTNQTVMAWLLEESGPDETEIKNGWLGSTGHGPWPEQELEASLTNLDYEFYQLPDGDLEYIIVGRKDWSKTDLLAQIDARDGQPLRIYSQEMFFAKLVTGRDPFDAEDESLLDAFAEDHPALQFLMSLPSPWPTVSDEESREIQEVDVGDFGVSESPLHILGYKVGTTSDLSISERRKILTQCFETRELEFSADSNDAYIAKWGRGGGAQRLYRMAVHIKNLADGRVGKDHRKPQARIDWIRDLNWLKEKYYPKYKARFSWP